MPSGVYIRTQEHLMKMKEARNRPETKNNISKGQLKRFSNPEEREKARERMIGRFAGEKNPMYGYIYSEEYKQSQREKGIERFKDPEERRKARERMMGKITSEETKQKQRDGANKRWEDPEEREKARQRGIGKNNPNWKDGKLKNSGYIYILFPEHPFSNKPGYVAEHRLVAEKQLGRYLTPKEVIHHINKIRDDNRPENLYLFENNEIHLNFHWHPYELKSNLIKQELSIPIVLENL